VAQLAGDLSWKGGGDRLEDRVAKPGLAMQNIIEISNATVYRGATKVFDALTLEIPFHCHTVILGPNGSGKSTLLKLLAREIYAAASKEGNGEASVKIFGQSEWNLWDLRSRLGIISSELQRDYSGSATGLEVVLSGLYSTIGIWPNQQFSRAQQIRARGILESVGGSHLADRPYQQMSAGEQRRLLLGRALIHNPEALVLDEPTSGLDIAACFQYLDIVRSLMRAGKTVVLVTHHLHEIPPEISRVVLLKKGRIVADGPKGEVLSSAALTRFYGIPIELHGADGFYWASSGPA
jgi:iron complex transport system ATP-binding protein